MKHFVLSLLLVLGTEGAPNPQFSLSSLTGAMANLLPAWPLMNKTEALAVHREGAKRAILTYGPLRVKAKGDPSLGKGGLDTTSQSGVVKINKGVCSDCSILSGRWTLRNATDRIPIDQKKIYIHHFVSIIPSHKIAMPIKGCQSKPDGYDLGMFIDRGQDSGTGETMFVSTDKSVESGYRFGANPLITVQYELVNYQEATDVVIDLELEWMDGVYGRDVGRTLNSVQCNPGKDDIKLDTTARAYTPSINIPILQDASIIWARGHLHQGGDSMELKINNNTMCVSKAEYGTEIGGDIKSMSLCPTPIRLVKGDMMQIVSVYDVPKHPLRQSADGSGHAAHSAADKSDVMGMMMITYALGDVSKAT